MSDSAAPEDGDDEVYGHYLDGERPVLQETFVGLLDLLGTSNALETPEGAQELLEVTDRALARASRDPEGIGVLVRWFTDNAAVVVPRERYGSLRLLSKSARVEALAAEAAILVVASVQYQLAAMGFFLRGGLAMGPFFASERFLFGAPLVDADQLEKTVADVPRVVLSKDFAEFAREQDRLGSGSQSDAFHWLLAEDDDGEVFVNYLGLVPDEDPGEDEAWLANHLNHIRSKWSVAPNSRVKRKYLWAGEYHDRFCRRYLEPGPALDRLLFDSDIPKQLPHIT